MSSDFGTVGASQEETVNHILIERVFAHKRRPFVGPTCPASRVVALAPFGGSTGQGEWDGLVPGEEYSSQIRDQSIRQNLADELVPPGTGARREARRFTPFTRSHCPLSLASSHSARAPPPTVSDDDGGLERQQAARATTTNGGSATTDSVMGRTAAAKPEAGRAAAVDPEEGRAAAVDPEARRATATTGEGECFDGGGGRRLGNGGFGGAATTTTTSECECSGCGSVDDDGR
uniref:Uncharacterized protein n=1 Tax=Oryza glumipatula TaxID=40148 RepID=A0A0E0B4B0_9ORYZ